MPTTIKVFRTLEQYEERRDYYLAQTDVLEGVGFEDLEETKSRVSNVLDVMTICTGNIACTGYEMQFCSLI